MKKIITLFLCINILSLNFACAEFIADELIKNLDKNLKIQKYKYEKIDDEFANNTLDNNLKIQKANKIYYNDTFVNETLNQNLKIIQLPKEQIEDFLVKTIDESKIIAIDYKKINNANFDAGKIKVSPKKYHTTRRKLKEGAFIDFVLAEDIKIENKTYKKGEIVKARIETLSPNGARGIPADLVIGNFIMPDNLALNGQITKQGANRSLWVYPLGCILTPFALLGVPLFAIRGGHAKLKPRKVYQVEI